MAASKSHENWLSIGMDTWLLGAEAVMVVGLRSAALAAGGASAWREAERMVTEKADAHASLGMALATGKLGSSPKSVLGGTVAHYHKRVRANRVRLSR